MKPTVLIIEDNEQNMYLLTFLLEQKGWTVFQAVHGRQGIDLARQHKPDLVLLDIQLPELDGYQVAALLRQDPSFQTTPIIAVTSHAMVGDREKCLAAGCSGYIEKPINPDSFISEIEKFRTD
ncbi:response regulator [bacterium]|nr:response regulator [bacterium]